MTTHRKARVQQPGQPRSRRMHLTTTFAMFVAGVGATLLITQYVNIILPETGSLSLQKVTHHRLPKSRHALHLQQGRQKASHLTITTTLVIYVFSPTDSEYLHNLQYFGTQSLAMAVTAPHVLCKESHAAVCTCDESFCDARVMSNR